ncbi:MAG: Ig-like domain-containing protein [Desulfobacterales bacterium]|nr:Ig-like domain-containing protein [Desulfobacterales bacterium]
MMFKRACCLFSLIFIAIFLASCGPTGGAATSTTSSSSTSSSTTTTTSEQDQNLSGTVVDEYGSPSSSTDVSVYSAKYTTKTDSSGKFSLKVEKQKHTIMISKDGILDTLQFVDLSDGSKKEISLLLKDSVVTASNKDAKTAYTIDSNKIDDKKATLDIPVQSSGYYEIDGEKASSSRISLEYINPLKPLPVPLPSKTTRSTDLNDKIKIDKQSPSVVVSIKPSLLTLSTKAKLTLPNPHTLSGSTKILWFDIKNHQWIDTGFKVSDIPFEISKGGFYGFFEESENKIGDVKGSGYAEGTLVFIGDQVAKAGSDGKVYFQDVFVPFNSESLNIINVKPESKDVSSSTVKPEKDTKSDIKPAVKVGSVSVSVGSSKIVANGTDQTVIRATVNDTSGKAMPNGTSVKFETSAGDIDNDTKESQTTYTADTKDGVATAYLTSGTKLGTANITATSGGVNGSGKVDFIAGPPEKITVTANPATLKADGKSTSTIKAKILDAQENPVADGEKISFTVDYGTLSEPNALTKNGEASVTYTSPSSGDKAKLTAKSTNDKSNDVYITLEGPQIASIELSASPSSIPADGISQSNIKAKVTQLEGGNAPDGTEVIFEIINGGKGTINPTKATTSDGIALTTLTSDIIAETVTIRAKAGKKVSEIQVEYTPGSISLTIVPNSFLGTGKENPADVTATVKTASGSAASGKTVTFTLSDEKMGSLSSKTSPTDAEGKAIVKFTADIKGGSVTIKASCEIEGKTVSGSESADVQPPPESLSNASGSPNPAAINVKGTGGQSTSQVTFDVKDSQGKAVVDGYRIDFSIDDGPNGGESISPTSVKTSGGQVSTILKSGTKSGPVSIKAIYYYNTNISTTSSQIKINAGPPVGEAFGLSREYLNMSGLKIIGLKDSIRASVGDIYGNPIPDNTAISFKTYDTGGLIETEEAKTTKGIAITGLDSAAAPVPLEGFLSVTSEANNGGKTTRVSAIAVTPAPDNNIIYVATNGGGIYKSTDSGISWTNRTRTSAERGANFIDPYVNDIVIDASDYNVLYAATGFGGKGNIYRSIDGGLNWNSNNAEEWDGVLYPKEYRDKGVLTILSGTEEANVNVYIWAGTDGGGVIYTKYEKGTVPLILNQFTRATGLGDGTTVKDIVKIKNKDILYAASTSGVYISKDKGASWNKTAGYFIGNSMTTLALHPLSKGDSGDIIYAGTKDAGVWVSKDSGSSWTSYNNGLGKGLSATTPIADINNKGNGTMSKATVGKNTKTEDWTITCITEVANGGVFKVESSVTTDKRDNYTIIENTPYTITDVITFEIKDGSADFKVDDKFTFSTTRDPGRDIKSLAVDATNKWLYAITYFAGDLEPHAVGNVYAYQIDETGSMIGTEWQEANKNLPQYDPPDDTTLYAQHALAFDNPDSPSAIFVGGEGINFYKATSDLKIGVPSWQKSKSGLTNLIMARKPIVFTDDCIMDVTLTEQKAASTPERDGNNKGDGTMSSVTVGSKAQTEDWTITCITKATDGGIFRVEGSKSGRQNNYDISTGEYVITDIVKFTIYDGTTDFEVGDKFTFSVSTTSVNHKVYIEDPNGNPPIKDSTFTVTRIYGDEATVVFSRKYGDTLISEGTFRNRNDNSTDIPYNISVKISSGVKVKLEFIPTCTDSAPGCSGASQSVIYTY